jgi:DNA-binding LacI/PurR family transcriptional regulator
MDSSPRASTRRVTIADIASASGVSIGAVSFALNGRKGVSDATRERVLGIADELGWAPARAARSLAEAKTDTIGFVLARDPYMLGVETFYMRFIAGLESEFAERGYALLLQMAPNRDEELLTLKRWRNSRQVDGVIVVDLAVDDRRVALLSKPGALPAIAVGDPSVARGLSSVWTDDDASMRSAVQYLSSLGHRRIARVAGLQDLAHTTIRDAAFRDETNKRGLEPTILKTDYTAEQSAAATRIVLRSAAPPTAFIYDNDIMAVAGLREVGREGFSVPADVSIIGWDDSVLCDYTAPSLTALSHDIVAFGAHVGRRLFDVIEGAEPGAFKDSTPELIVRESTGPAPQESQ